MGVSFRFAQMACCCVGLLLASGCIGPGAAGHGERQAGMGERLYFAPVKIKISPVTELIPASTDGEMDQIRVCVALLDPFESYLKAPGTFRFELYEKVLRSAAPKGKRIHMWAPDLDLRTPQANNEYWQEVWHAYEFDLTRALEKDKNYILQVTFTLPNSRRLTDEHAL